MRARLSVLLPLAILVCMVACATASAKLVSKPVISGTMQEGSTLSTTNGTWTQSVAFYTYQWQHCVLSGGNYNTCSNIAGATSQTYVLTGSAQFSGGAAGGTG